MIIEIMNKFANIRKLAQEMVYLYDLKYEIAKPKVYEIINKKITDTNYVERVLDRFLDIPTDKGYELLKILYNYWININKESADFYLKEFEKQYIKKD